MSGCIKNVKVNQSEHPQGWSGERELAVVVFFLFCQRGTLSLTKQIMVMLLKPLLEIASRLENLVGIARRVL